jgi:hypothetical protein
MTTFYAAILLLPLADGMTLFFLNPCLTGGRSITMAYACALGLPMQTACLLALHYASWLAAECGVEHTS